MIRKIFALLFVSALSVPVLADDKTDALLPVSQFVDGMNRGDLESAFKACGSEMIIIDNVAPYSWQGADACQRWAESQEADATAKGMSDIAFKLGEAAHFQSSNDKAYAVLLANYTYTLQGRVHNVNGTLTAAIQKGPSGWTMVGFAFSER